MLKMINQSASLQHQEQLQQPEICQLQDQRPRLRLASQQLLMQMGMR